MKFRVTLYLLAFPLLLMGSVQLVFALLSWLVFFDDEGGRFIASATSILTVALVLLGIGKKFDIQRVGFRESLLFAVLTWIIMALLGAIPIQVMTELSWVDSVFEAMSGLTTTGATMLSDLDNRPKSFLMYRQFLQWLGGLGVVIFVVAILPMLNVGGMRLLKAETPGPIKDDKLTPRIMNTTHYLWLVYIVISISCALAYYLVGMSAFDAVGHMFSTVSTGGFSTHDASMAYFDNSLMLWVCDLFMLLGAMNVMLHFRVFYLRNLSLYWQDEEWRYFMLLVLGLCVLITYVLLKHNHYQHIVTTGTNAVFMLISVMTSSGFGVGDYPSWPMAVIFFLLISSYLGGCAGSTAGGSKIIRIVLMLKVIALNLQRLTHPQGVFHVKYQGEVVEPSILSATMAFLFIELFLSIIFSLLLMATGVDFFSSFAAVASAINNGGYGFGAVSSNFAPLNDAGTVILTIAMLLGRLEYMTVLVLLLPSFWRS